MSDDLTEFSWIEPDEVHLVKTPANAFDSPLLAKAAEALSETEESLIKSFVDGLCGVSGCPTCHERYQALKETPGFVEKARMKAKERHALSDSDFAFPKERKEPLNDEGHVRAAMGRFSQVEGVTAEERKAAARKIIARAKALGIDVSEDSDVARAAKETADPGPSEVQTRSVEEPPGAGPDPTAQPEGDAKHIAFPHPPESDGTGDPAPDKDLHRSEAESQTDDNVEGNEGTLKAEGDGTGDHLPDEDVDPSAEEGQTRELGKGDADSDPGSPAWEHKDVALGEKAEDLVAQLADVVREFTKREKAEGGASKSLRRAARTARSLLNNPKKLRKVAHTMSDTNELVKVLGEYDKARRAEKKAAKKAADEKAAKKAAKAAEKAAKAAGSDSELAKALERAEAAEKAAAEARELAEKIAAEDAKRVPVSGAGIAALRGAPAEVRESVLKQFDERIEAAEAALEKATTPMARERARADRDAALRQRFLAKRVAQENAARRGELSSEILPGAFPIFKDGSTYSLGEDEGLRYGGVRR